jgi:hypothetical protein
LPGTLSAIGQTIRGIVDIVRHLRRGDRRGLCGAVADGIVGIFEGGGERAGRTGLRQAIETVISVGNYDTTVEIAKLLRGQLELLGLV